MAKDLSGVTLKEFYQRRELTDASTEQKLGALQEEVGAIDTFPDLPDKEYSSDDLLKAYELVYRAQNEEIGKPLSKAEFRGRLFTFTSTGDQQI